MKQPTVDLYGRLWPDAALRKLAVCEFCGQPLVDIQNEALWRVVPKKQAANHSCHHYVLSADKVHSLGGTLPAGGVDPNDLYCCLWRADRPFYIKVGRRYHCMGILDHIRGEFTNGHYLMTVRQGSVGYRSIAPADAEVEAVMGEVGDAMVKALDAANRVTADTTPLTPKERKAWQAYCKAVGDNGASITYRGCSMYDLVQAGLKVLRDRLAAGKVRP